MQPGLIHVELARACRPSEDGRADVVGFPALPRRVHVPDAGPPPKAPPGRLRRRAARVLATVALRVDGDTALRTLIR